MDTMTRLTEEFKRAWHGVTQPSPLVGTVFAAVFLVLATLLRWSLAHLRSDIFFSPYIPAVFLACALGGRQVGTVTALAGGVLGLVLHFGSDGVDSARFALLAVYLVACALMIWGLSHYRTIAAQQRAISLRLTEEEAYRKLVVDELQHRLKNKTSTIHAVLHQVLHDQPQVWATIDRRIRALATADDLITKVDGQGCDLKDLLVAELGPYGHVRFDLHGEPVFLPAKLAVSLSLVFHELATNAGKYGAFSSPRGFLQVSWTRLDDRLKLTWDETEGPMIEDVGRPGFGTKLLGAALLAFDGKTETSYLKTGIHCTMQCRIPPS